MRNMDSVLLELCVLLFVAFMIVNMKRVRMNKKYINVGFVILVGFVLCGFGGVARAEEHEVAGGRTWRWTLFP